MVSAISYTSILSFGDSLTDNGTNGSDTYGYQHYTNGNGLGRVPGRLVPSERTAFRYGSYGGATTSDGFPNLGWQVDTYLANVSSSVPSGTLVTVWAGANDYPNMDQPARQLLNVASAVGELANAGGQYFLVPNLPDAGLTPMFRGTPLHSEPQRVGANSSMRTWRRIYLA